MLPNGIHNSCGGAVIVTGYNDGQLLYCCGCGANVVVPLSGSIPKALSTNRPIRD